MKVLLKNFNRKSNKYEIGRQEIFHISMEGLKNLISLIPYDTSNTTIPVKIITKDLIFEKLDRQILRYEWNFFYTYRFIRRKKLIKIQELNQLIYGSKKKFFSILIDLVLIILYFYLWVFLCSFNTQSLYHFMFNENTNKSVNLFFLWLIILTWIGILNYVIKNFLINLILYRKKFLLEYNYTIIDDIQKIDVTNLLFLISQYLYIIFIYYYFLSVYLRHEGLILYISLVIIGSILIIQELFQTCKDWYLNYKKKKNYLCNLYKLTNYCRHEDSLKYLTIASNLKKVNLIDRRLWKILIGLLIFLLSLLPIL
ncbi:hypothetical protein ES703_97356 [subsurface metagenome]